jgi:hypothetical protein
MEFLGGQYVEFIVIDVWSSLIWIEFAWICGSLFGESG